MAKQEEVTLWLKLKDGITKAFGEIKDSVTKNINAIKKSALLFAGIYAGIMAAVYKSIQAFQQQQDANALLDQALKNTGNFTKAASADLQAYASDLQRITKYGDETIVSSMAMIASFGIEGDQLKALTKATLDLATAKGMDLKSAADLVAKSVGSSTNALARYGVQIKGAAGSTERANMAIEAISNLFGGQAQAQANTFSGSVERMKNAISDAMEDIGEVFVPVLKDMANVIASAAIKFKEIYPSIKDLIIPVAILTAGITGLMTVAAGIITIGPTVGAAITAMTGPIGIAITTVAALTAAVVYFATSGSNLAISVRAAWNTSGTIIMEYGSAIWEEIKRLGEIFGNFGEMLGNVVLGRFKEAKQSFADMTRAAADLGTAIVEASETVAETYEANLEAEREALEASREAKAEDQQIRMEMDIADTEAKVELDQDFLDRKAELEKVAEEARRQFESQKKLFDRMTAADRLKFLSDTLGSERLLRETAQMDEMISKGNHEEAKKKLNELYQEAFKTSNKSMIDEFDKSWKSHWDAQIATAIFGRNMTQQQYTAMGNFFSDLTTLMGKESLEAFRIMQAASIAETLIKTYESAQLAFTSLAGIPIVGPVLGGVAAGVAVAAGLARVDIIARQQPPQAETGAYVSRGGLAELHDQEMVLNREQTVALAAGGGTQHIYLQLDRETLQHWIRAADVEAARMEKLGVR